jgi:hypothetical protein
VVVFPILACVMHLKVKWGNNNFILDMLSFQKREYFFSYIQPPGKTLVVIDSEVLRNAWICQMTYQVHFIAL